MNSTDFYWRLDLEKLKIPQKVRNMIYRASKELFVEKTKKIGNEHLRIMSEFFRSKTVEPAIQSICKGIPDYISKCEHAFVFNSKIKATGHIIGFSIADYTPKNYAFYMFNFVSDKKYYPGASDLLLYEIIKTAQKEEKKYVNLGLGINEGIKFFKKKWGGYPFLSYEFYLYEIKRCLFDRIVDLFK